MGSPGHLVWCLMVSESRLLLPQFAIFSMWLRPQIKNSSPTSTVWQAEIKEQRGKQPSKAALRSLTVGHKYTNTSVQDLVPWMHLLQEFYHQFKKWGGAGGRKGENGHRNNQKSLLLPPALSILYILFRFFSGLINL